MMRKLMVLGVLLGMAGVGAGRGQQRSVPAVVDEDGDGLSDPVEQELLRQFLPEFRVSAGECDERPAMFTEGLERAVPVTRDGTIYGQATPRGTDEAGRRLVELHFYDLWAKDCGRHGHVLDAEHVSALLVNEEGRWRARYWFAAAHEATMCDMSQVATGRALGAEEHGPVVWLSAGKHAAYLAEVVCNGGCGADRCAEAVALRVPQVVNLGEPGHAMNGAEWVGDARWPMRAKLATDFPAEAMAWLEAGEMGAPVEVLPGRSGVRRTIYVANATYGGLAEGASGVAVGAAGVSAAASRTSAALGTADDETEGALGRAAGSTGAALGTSAQKTGRALGAAARWVKHGGRRDGHETTGR